MVRILSRSMALVFAVTVVGVAGWCFFQPYVISHVREWVGETLVDVWPSPWKPPVDWQQIDAGIFTFSAPVGTHLEKWSDIDTHGGRISGDGICIRYMFSNFTDGLEHLKGNPDYSETWLGIDGRPALIRRATMRKPEEEFELRECGHRYVAGLFIPYAFYVGTPPGRSDGMALTLEGAAANEGERARIEAIFKSIRFKKTR